MQFECIHNFRKGISRYYYYYYYYFYYYYYYYY